MSNTERPNVLFVDNILHMIQKPLLTHTVFFLKEAYGDLWWDKVIGAFRKEEQPRIQRITDDCERIDAIKDLQKILKIITFPGHDKRYNALYDNGRMEKRLNRLYGGSVIDARNMVMAHNSKDISKEEAIQHTDNILRFINDIDESLSRKIRNERAKLNKHAINGPADHPILNEPAYHELKSKVDRLQNDKDDLLRTVCTLSNVIRQKDEDLRILKDQRDSIDKHYTDNELKELLEEAQNGSDSAMFELADYYDTDERLDPKKMMFWLKSAIAEGNVRAERRLGYYYYYGDEARSIKQSYADALELWQKAAEQGDANAQNNLGWMYYKGNGVEQSYENAYEWFSKAAEQGHAKAQFNLGWRHYNGEGVEQSYEKAFEWFSKAAEQGHAGAQHNLGWMYSRGEGVEQSYEKGFEWFSKAVEQGDADAQNSLGWMYYKGNGVEQSYEKAYGLWMKAAEQGQFNAQNNLGLLYAKGKGVGQSYKKAFEWYSKAAEHGNTAAQNGLGRLHEHGLGVQQSYEKAVYWYSKAAEQNSDSAKNNLGWLLLNGNGAPMNHAKAFELFSESKDGSDGEETYRMAVMYEKGLGVEGSEEKAAELYNSVASRIMSNAENGCMECQFILGEMYEYGRGVERDPELAEKWYRTSAENGDIDAKNKLSIL